MARLAFIGIWTFSDDAGVHPASYQRLKAEVFPGDDIGINAIASLVAEMIGNGLVDEFQAEGKLRSESVV